VVADDEVRSLLSTTAVRSLGYIRIMRPWPAAAAFAALALAQQTPVIRVPVRLVTIPTLVFSPDGRLLNGLAKSDFRLSDNRRPQAITLDAETNPVSLAIAVQANRDVREYLGFIAHTGSLIDALLAGENGATALIACADEVTLVKPFDSGDLAASLKKLSPEGKSSRMLDGAARAIDLLRQRPASDARILLLIGQPADSGSETSLDSVREEVEQENLTVYTLTLPELGKAFVSDTFSLQGVSWADRGGFRAGADLKHLLAVLDRAAAAQQAADPFSALTVATGGTQMRFRKQAELEGALAAIGLQVRSAYILSYAPDSRDPGYHTVSVEVASPGAKVYARPGYWMK